MALYDFNALPGLGTARENAERTFLWGKHEQAMFRSIILDSSSTDLNNSAVSTYELRPGLLLAQKTTNKWVPYNPVATDGSEVAMGVLSFAVKMLDLSGSTSDKVAVAVVGGPVKGSQLIKNVSGSPSIDPQARAQLYNYFKFDDDLPGNKYEYKHTITKAADYTVTVADNMTVFEAITGAVNFTLPALNDAAGNPQCKGVKFKFYQTTANNMVITAPGSDRMVALNNASVTTITFSTGGQQIGAWVEVETNTAGTKWLATVGNGATATLA